jgi:pilus assembly protein Flp/PilA
MEFQNMEKLLIRFGKDRSGATALEYGLIAALIAVVIIASVTKLGTGVSAKFGIIANNLS